MTCARIVLAWNPLYSCARRWKLYWKAASICCCWVATVLFASSTPILPIQRDFTRTVLVQLPAFCDRVPTCISNEKITSKLNRTGTTSIVGRNIFVCSTVLISRKQWLWYWIRMIYIHYIAQALLYQRLFCFVFCMFARSRKNARYIQIKFMSLDQTGR